MAIPIVLLGTILFLQCPPKTHSAPAATPRTQTHTNTHTHTHSHGPPPSVTSSIQPRHRGEGPIFQGHAEGLRQGRIQGGTDIPAVASVRAEELNGQSWGAAMGQSGGEGGLPSNPSHLILLRPPGNLNPSSKQLREEL